MVDDDHDHDDGERMNHDDDRHFCRQDHRVCTVFSSKNRKKESSPLILYVYSILLVLLPPFTTFQFPGLLQKLPLVAVVAAAVSVLPSSMLFMTEYIRKSWLITSVPS